MVTAQVRLSNAEGEALRELARRSGKTEEQLVREAVERLLTEAGVVDRLALLRQARGVWHDRTDLPDPKELRAELDRS
jgi:hypothetical protein